MRSSRRCCCCSPRSSRSAARTWRCMRSAPGVAALLLCGCFVGEERILARHAQSRAPSPAHAGPPLGAPSPDRVVSLFARSPRTLRGPPALAAA